MFTPAPPSVLAIMTSASRVVPVVGSSPIVAPSALRRVAYALLAQFLFAALRGTERNYDNGANRSWTILHDYDTVAPNFDLTTALAEIAATGSTNAGLPSGKIDPQAYINALIVDPPAIPGGSVPQIPVPFDPAVFSVQFGKLIDAVTAEGAQNAAIDAGLAATCAESLRLAQVAFQSQLDQATGQPSTTFGYSIDGLAAPGAPFTITDRTRPGSPPVGTSATLAPGTYRFTISGVVRSDGVSNPTTIAVALVVDGVTVATTSVGRSSGDAPQYVSISLVATVTVVSTVQVVNAGAYTEFAALAMGV